MSQAACRRRFRDPRCLETMTVFTIYHRQGETKNFEHGRATNVTVTSLDVTFLNVTRRDHQLPRFRGQAPENTQARRGRVRTKIMRNNPPWPTKNHRIKVIGGEVCTCTTIYINA